MTLAVTRVFAHMKTIKFIPKTIKFIPVAHGDRVDFGDIGIFGISGKHKYLGFKPGPARKRAGWIVVAVSGSGGHPKRLRRR